MPELQNRRKIKVREFMEDYLQGSSGAELCELHSLSEAQLRKVLNKLRANGDIGEKELEIRKKNIDLLEAMGRSSTADGATPVQVDLDTGLVLHCPSCAASVKRDSERCAYCDSPLDFSLKGKTTHCPHCFQKIPADSKFCMICAKPAAKQRDEAAMINNHPCPRCECLLKVIDIAGFSVSNCPECEGLFIPPETFEMMQDSSKRVIESVIRQGKRQYELDYKVIYLPCPICGKFMTRRNFAATSGIIIDVCSEHGVWFDKGEMEKIMDFVAKGGIQKARKAQLERLKDETRREKWKQKRLVAEAHYPSGFGANISVDIDSDSILDMLQGVVTTFMKHK